MNDDEAMERCIELAREAYERGDHPFSSILVRDGQVFAEGQNRVNTKVDPTAHAETEVIREACKALESLNLRGFTLYASGEPCWMCSQVIRQVQIERVVIGELSRWPTGGRWSLRSNKRSSPMASTRPRGCARLACLWRRSAPRR